MNFTTLYTFKTGRIILFQTPRQSSGFKVYGTIWTILALFKSSQKLRYNNSNSLNYLVGLTIFYIISKETFHVKLFTLSFT